MFGGGQVNCKRGRIRMAIGNITIDLANCDNQAHFSVLRIIRKLNYTWFWRNEWWLKQQDIFQLNTENL